MTIQEFQDKLEARDAIQVNRTTDACCWYFEGVHVFHERTFLGYSRQAERECDTPAKQHSRLMGMAFKSMVSHYWSSTFYKDLQLANRDAKRLGGVVEKAFYCDDNDPAWFIIFDDFDKAAAHAFENLQTLIKQKEELTTT